MDERVKRQKIGDFDHSLLSRSRERDDEDAEMEDAGDMSSERVQDFAFGPANHTNPITGMDAENTLAKMGICDQNTMGPFTFVPDPGTLDSFHCGDQQVNRFCWVFPVDAKGGPPELAQRLIYCLHHVQKFVDHVPKGVGSKKAPFELRNAIPNDATVTYRGGHAFHYYTTRDYETKSMPVLSLRTYVDVATTCLVAGLSQAYMFVVLECPLTVEFCELVNLSCKYICDAESVSVCESLKASWVDIADYQSKMDGQNEHVSTANFASVRFHDLFDDLSSHCMNKLFRISRCIASARRHMHVIACRYRANTMGEPWKEASQNVCIRFQNIDEYSIGKHDPYEYDRFFAELSDRSAACQYQSYEQYKRLAEKHAKKRRAAQRGRPPRDNDEGEGGEDAADVEGDEPMAAWAPPKVWDCQPTFVDYSSSSTSSFMRHMISSDSSVDVEAFEEFIQGEGAASLQMGGFGKAKMCASIELGLLKNTTSKYQRFCDWKDLNPVPFPRNMSLQLLMDVGSRSAESADGVTDPFSIFVSVSSNNLQQSVLTLADYRRFLMSGGDTANNNLPLKGRCANIYEMQYCAVQRVPDPASRVQTMYRNYVQNTVVPLVKANIQSDNGSMGGSDKRLTVLSAVASHGPDEKGTEFVTWIGSKFNAGLRVLRENHSVAESTLSHFQGQLAGAEALLFSLFEVKNINANLKPGNQHIDWLLHISDIGYSLLPASRTLSAYRSYCAGTI